MLVASVVSTSGGFGPGRMMGPGMMGWEPGPTAPPKTSVRTAGARFDPATVSVAAGETVRWFNDDALPHTVTAADRSWDSGNLPPGASFERRFDVAGNYQYLCRYHSGMVGTIAEDVLTGDSAELFVAVVTAASLDLDLTRRPHPQG